MYNLSYLTTNIQKFFARTVLMLSVLSFSYLVHANDTGFSLRINAGGENYTDSAGHLWRADEAYNTGRVSSIDTAISGTDDPELYQSARWDAATVPELHYSFDVPNGSYTVSLYFADTWSGTQGVGLRVFDVALEEQPALTDLDIFSEVGGSAALVKVLT